MELPCIVSHVVFSKENGFAILAVYLNRNSPVYSEALETIIPNADNKMGAKHGMFSVSKRNSDDFVVSLDMWNCNEQGFGQQYVFVGDFIEHPKYGKQFKAEFYYQDDISALDASGLKAFLMTMPYIKEARSKAIVNH